MERLNSYIAIVQSQIDRTVEIECEEVSGWATPTQLKKESAPFFFFYELYMTRNHVRIAERNESTES